jgi:hypothetical protein
MSSKKENEGHLIQRVNRYVSTLGKCPVVNSVVLKKQSARPKRQRWLLGALELNYQLYGMKLIL